MKLRHRLVYFLTVGLAVSLLSMFVIRFIGLQATFSIVYSSSSSSSSTSVAEPEVIVPCVEEEEDDLHSLLGPSSNLLHRMNDTQLLWRASLVPRVKKYPFPRTPKIAFMFLTKGPLPLSPLWERFFHGHEDLFSIYIHSPPSYVANFSSSSVFYMRQIPSQVVEWGMMSMCDAERRLLANALLDMSNEWFILLSESCIPLCNFTTTYVYVSQSDHSFVGSFDERGPHGRGRYSRKMQPEVTLRQWRKGSQWFEVDRRLAVSIIEDAMFYPKFRDFCRHGCYVDEHYFPTMLSVQVPHLLANRTLTWTDWSHGGAHPAMFTQADISYHFFHKILGTQLCSYNGMISTVCFLFARKFAPNTLSSLLQLASDVFWI